MPGIAKAHPRQRRCHDCNGSADVRIWCRSWERGEEVTRLRIEQRFYCLPHSKQEKAKRLGLEWERLRA